MRSFFAIYSLPGKILAHLWYLWPKKGEVWASARRRDHGFVHFLYSTVIYAVAAFIITSPHGSSKHVSSVDSQQLVESANDMSTDGVPMQDLGTDYDRLAEEPVQEAAPPTIAEVPPAAAPKASEIEFVSNPVVQLVGSAPEQQNVPPCSQTLTDGCIQ